MNIEKWDNVNIYVFSGFIYLEYFYCKYMEIENNFV